MTIFSHSVIAGSSSMASTRRRRFGAGLGVVAIVIGWVGSTGGMLAQAVLDQYMTERIDMEVYSV
jgi:hypothetical protein